VSDNDDSIYPWLQLQEPDDAQPLHTFEPFKISKKQIAGLAMLITHAAKHVCPELDEIEAEISIKHVLGRLNITGETACEVGKCLEYSSLVNLLPENIDRAN
jgi:hypothetical protein